MAIIKNLTARNCTALGIVRRADLDFEDDGNNFRGFDYKGLPITVLRSDNHVYLDIREDYLERPYTWEEWKEVDGWRLTDKFNGVPQIDTDDLIETLEKVIELRNNLIETIKNKPIDYDRVERQLKAEVLYAKGVVVNFKQNFKWYDAGAYDLKRLIGYMKSLEGKIKATETNIQNLKTLQRSCVQEYVELLNKYGHIKFYDTDFYIEELNEAVEGNK